MAHPVLVHFNQIQSALMSNPSGFLSAPGFWLYIHVNICSSICGKTRCCLIIAVCLVGVYLLAKLVGRSKHNSIIEHIDSHTFMTLLMFNWP